MKKKSNQKEFWVSNISDRNVCLADLALTVPAGKSMNLLDSRHHKYTEEQLHKSRENGSLYKKSNLVKTREVAPPEQLKPGMYLSQTPIYMKFKVLSEPIEEPYFEELEIASDEKFADEISNDIATDGVNPLDTLAQKMAKENKE